MKKLVITFFCVLLYSSISDLLAQNAVKSASLRPASDSSKNIRTYKASEIKEYKSKGIEVQNSKQIEIHKSSDIKIHKAKEVEIYKSKEIDEYKSKNMDSHNGNDVLPNAKHDEKKVIEKKIDTKNDNNKNNVESLIGTWHTRIPGAVWQTPSGRDGYDNLHVSSGLKSGDLVINANGTYKWNSYGGKKGNWIKGDSGYPIVLIDNVEKKKWRVGYDSKHTGGRDIIIWDGYIWYDGKK